jgi:hypothetical protein
LVNRVDKSLEKHAYEMENNQLKIFGIVMNYDLIQSMWSTLITGIAALIQAQFQIISEQ